MSNKLKSYRLPEDLIKGLDETAKELNLEETELVRRGLRYWIRQVKKDRTVLVSEDASKDLPSPL